MRGCCKQGDSSLFVHLLVCLFGIGSWIAINGLWVELPILVQHLPEAWNLGSYLVIIIQVANIGPLLFTVATTLAPGYVKEKVVVYIIVSIGIVSCLLLAFLWDTTSFIAGREHSTALLVLQFSLALVDCTSSVVFLPYMAVFKPQYMTTYFIGEGFSGLLPSLVALGQGAGAVKCVNQSSPAISNVTQTEAQDTGLVPEYLEPNFPVKNFFLFLFAMMLVCGISFTCLNHHPKCKKEKAKTNKKSEAESRDQAKPDVKQVEFKNNISQGVDGPGCSSSDSANSSSQLLPDTDRRLPTDVTVYSTTTEEVSYETNDDNHLSLASFVYLLVLTAWINALSNGVLPSIQSYSALPYGTNPYHLAVTLGSMANPLACFIAFFLSTISKLLITALTLIGSGVAAYIILLASLSPAPYYVGETTGTALVVLSWVVTTLCLTYSKVCIAMILREKGRRGLLWCGALTQIGSAAGAIPMFVLVSILNLFSPANTC